MKYTTKNLLLFRQYFNNLYHQLRNQERNTKDYVINETNVQLPNLLVKVENDNIIPLHSQYDPVNEATKWIKNQETEIESSENVLIYGFGLGYHIEKFIELYPEKRLYIYEPDKDILLAAIETRDLSRILKHPNIIVFGIGMVKQMMMNLIVEQVTTSFVMLVQTAYRKMFKEDVQGFSQDFKQIILNTRSNIATYINFYEQWPENIILNMNKYLGSAPFSYLKDKLGGYPALIVGSGPSLDLEIDNIKKIRENALVFAAGTSIQGLMSYEIKPDLIGAIDGSEKFADAFRNLNYHDIPMLYTSMVKTSVIEPIHQNLFHCFVHTDILTKYLMQGCNMNIPTFNSTFSVTGLLVQAAVYMGCNPIIFVGQDMSYPNKQFYARNITHFNDKEIEEFQLSMQEQINNVDGGVNPTNKAMLNTLLNLEETIRIQGDTVKFINSSKHGAVIKGADYLPLSQVYEKLRCQVIDRKKYKETLDYGQTYYSTKQKQIVLKNMNKSKKDLELTNKQLIKLYLIIEQLKRANSSKKINELLVDIDRIWRKIAVSEVFKNIYQMVVQAQLMVYTRFIPTIVEEKDTFKKGELICKHLGFLVVKMAEITPKLIAYFDEAIKQINEEHA